MIIAWTNRGTFRMLESVFRNVPILSGFAIALITDSVLPSLSTVLLGELEEIVSGNGYTSGGVTVSRDSIGFPVIIQDDVLNKSSIIMKDVIFTASGGILPVSGNGIKFIVLTDNNTTIGDREVYAFAEFIGTAKILPDTGVLSILELKLSLMEP